MSEPALGLLMLVLIVVVIMMGFATAFTLTADTACDVALCYSRAEERPAATVGLLDMAVASGRADAAAQALTISGASTFQMSRVQRMIRLHLVSARR